MILSSKYRAVLFSFLFLMVFAGFSQVHIPRKAQKLYDKGVELFKARQFPKGIECLTHAVEIAPHFSQAHYRLGLAYQSMFKLEQSLSHFEKAIHHVKNKEIL